MASEIVTGDQRLVHWKCSIFVQLCWNVEISPMSFECIFCVAYCSLEHKYWYSHFQISYSGVGNQVFISPPPQGVLCNQLRSGSQNIFRWKESLCHKNVTLRTLVIHPEDKNITVAHIANRFHFCFLLTSVMYETAPFISVTQVSGPLYSWLYVAFEIGSMSHHQTAQHPFGLDRYPTEVIPLSILNGTQKFTPRRESVVYISCWYSTHLEIRKVKW